MQQLMERSGHSTHFLLSMLIKHLDHKNVVPQPQIANNNFLSTAVHFYSLRCHSYVHQLEFQSAIYAVRCSSCALSVTLATQTCCFDPTTLEKTFSVLTYPITQGSQVLGGVNIGYGPMDDWPEVVSIFSKSGSSCRYGSDEF